MTIADQEFHRLDPCTDFAGAASRPFLRDEEEDLDEDEVFDDVDTEDDFLDEDEDDDDFFEDDEDDDGLDDDDVDDEEFDDDI